MSNKFDTVSVIVPTYNEVANIGALLKELAVVLLPWDYEIIVVDDNSPDNTFSVVEQMAESNPRIRGIKRAGKLGLGSAVLAGFRASRGNLIAMMDSDLSHQPRDLQTLLFWAKTVDIAIGSRYVNHGTIQGWSPFRHLSSRAARTFAKLILGLHVNDVMSGFAVFRRVILERVEPTIHPKGFKFLLEVLVMSPNAQTLEVPITFRNRTRGRSKFGPGEVMTFLRLCLALRRYRTVGHA